MSDQNQDPNILQKAGDFATDAAVDTAADSVINQGLDAVEAHVPIPGGQTVDKMISTEVDQVANNEINAELNKGVGGMMSDVEGLFGHPNQ
jgi:hypothetical protein